MAARLNWESYGLPNYLVSPPLHCIPNTDHPQVYHYNE